MKICSFRSSSLKQGKKKWIRNIYLYVLKKGKKMNGSRKKKKINKTETMVTYGD